MANPSEPTVTVKPSDADPILKRDSATVVSPLRRAKGRGIGEIAPDVAASLQKEAAVAAAVPLVTSPPGGEPLVEQEPSVQVKDKESHPNAAEEASAAHISETEAEASRHFGSRIRSTQSDAAANVMNTSDSFWDIDGALTLQPLQNAKVGQVGFLAGGSGGGTDPLAGSLTLLAAVTGLVLFATRIFGLTAFQKTSAETLLKGEEEAKKVGDSKIISSSVIYDRSRGYEPFYVALVKQASGDLALARVHLPEDRMEAYKKMHDEDKEAFKDHLNEVLVEKLILASQKTNAPKPPPLPLGKRILGGINRFAELAGSFLVSYGIWFAVFQAIITSIAQISPAELVLGPIGAFVIPAAAMVLQLAYSAYRAYKNRNNPAPTAHDHLMLEILAKIKIAENQSNEIKGNLNTFKDEKLKGLNPEARKALEDKIDAETKKADGERVTPAASAADSTYVKGMQSNSKARWARIILKTLVGTIGGFSIVYWTLAPIVNLATIAGTTALSASGFMIPVLVAMGIASMLGFVSFRAAKQSENNQAKDYDALNKQLLGDLKALEADVANKREQLQELKTQENKDVVAKPSFGEAFKAFTARMDNSNFVNNLSVTPKTSWQKLKSRIGKVVNRGLVAIGGASTSSFVIQMVFGLVGSVAVLGAVSNPFSLAGIGILLAFVVAGWGIAKILNYQADKHIKQAETKLDQVSAHLESLNQERKALVNQIGLLKALAPEPTVKSQETFKADRTHFAEKGHIAADSAAPVAAATAAHTAVPIAAPPHYEAGSVGKVTAPAAAPVLSHRAAMSRGNELAEPDDRPRSGPR